MARNTGKVGFTDVNSLNEPNDKIVKEIMKGADLKSTANNKNKGGRKTKEVKADKTIRVYVTEAQKILVEEYCLKTGMSESTLVKHLLIKEGVL
ncbi:hypothetical protein [Pelosinus propionicus]|uniref:Uncharacterized protein n=1 Tax=Pelosinus propionicus DSM 13327 TaxID=1123291 RepID=A0A1I4PSY3_9FIRM|nr:hypothetical protein [Pelosinus propionicus]SFM30887.1 hypothetical protein SAMN04490355_107212 [Pelosinus propionicus DSM 13327]